VADALYRWHEGHEKVLPTSAAPTRLAAWWMVSSSGISKEGTGESEASRSVLGQCAPMATDMTVIVEDRPGMLADLGEATGKAGLNIYGVAGIPCEGHGVIHLLVSNAAETRTAVEAAGLEVADQREVLIIDLQDRPGEMGEIARHLADAGVNIDLVYGIGNRMVIGCDDLEKARAAFKRWPGRSEQGPG
jgi:hypothetical protein